jgi:hypothetical protein
MSNGAFEVVIRSPGEGIFHCWQDTVNAAFSPWWKLQMETPPPAISGISPAAGPVGTVVTVSGSGLSTVTNALLGDLAADLRVVSDQTVVVTVPSNAVDGDFVLKSPFGDATSPPFKVQAAGPIQVPQPTGFGSLWINNQTADADTLTVWLVEVDVPSGSNENWRRADVGPNLQVKVSDLQRGKVYSYFAASHNWVARYNADFSDSIDATSREAAMTANFQRAFRQGFPGLDSGPPLVDTIG